MKIALASDHGGYDLKCDVKKYLDKKRIPFVDFGCNTLDSCDYSDFGFQAAESVRLGETTRGILICKSGVGMSIVANKVKGIRAALCWNKIVAEQSRKHNDSNIMVLPAMYIDKSMLEHIIDIWLSTEFEGGRHQRRIDKIAEHEKGFIG